ncbi:MAG: F0F1 ATP synthase subunit B [Thermoanaerobaculales bacterium]
MEFDWTTFGLEALNFLVLVWLLKRFFYRPVLAVIEARRAESAKTITDAEAVRREADGLKSEYQAHLAEVDEERAAAKAQLDAEIAAERARRLAALEAEIAEERKRREALEARERSEIEHALERQAMAIAARFATRLLERLAGPELEAKLADLALSEIEAQAPDKREALRTALREPGVTIKVVSSYPLDAARRAAFTQALGRLAGRALAPEFAEDTVLKAGICIMAGSWVLMANLRDELNFFATAFEHGG